MELITAEEIEETVAYAELLLERMKNEPELADQFVESTEKRILTEQPEESPKERYERLFFNGNDSVE